MLNEILLQGRLTKDVELRYTQSQKPVANFTLACERDFAQSGEKREADYVECVAWSNTANFAQKYFNKGDMAVVSGRLQSRDWTDKTGAKRRQWEIVVDRMYFCGGKRNAEDEYARSEREGKREDYRPAGAPVNVSAWDFEEPEGFPF